jgi:hypothetical protein
MQEILRKFGFGIKSLIFGFEFVYQIWVRVWICSLDLGSSLDLVSTTWMRFRFGLGLGFVQILEGLQNSYPAEFRMLYLCLYQVVQQFRKNKVLLRILFFQQNFE